MSILNRFFPPKQKNLHANDARLIAIEANERLQKVLKMIKTEAKKGEVMLYLRADVYPGYANDTTLRHLLRRLNYGLSSAHLYKYGLVIYWYN